MGKVNRRKSFFFLSSTNIQFVLLPFCFFTSCSFFTFLCLPLFSFLLSLALASPLSSFFPPLFPRPLSLHLPPGGPFSASALMESPPCFPAPFASRRLPSSQMLLPLIVLIRLLHNPVQYCCSHLLFTAPLSDLLVPEAFQRENLLRAGRGRRRARFGGLVSIIYAGCNGCTCV